MSGGERAGSAGGGSTAHVALPASRLRELSPTKMPPPSAENTAALTATASELTPRTAVLSRNAGKFSLSLLYEEQRAFHGKKFKLATLHALPKSKAISLQWEH